MTNPTHPASGEAKRDAWIARIKAMGPDDARALLIKRADEIDLHMRRFPDTLDRSMEETAAAIRIVLSATPSPDKLKIAIERLEVARAQAERGSKTPGVEEWRAQSMCRNVVALIDAALSALKGEG